MDVVMECMQVTSFGGEAKSLGMLAISQARNGEFEQAHESLAKAEEALNKSHASHMKLLSYDADNEDLRVSLFMVHAADHLNAAEVVTALANEFVLLYEERGK